jgi:predicted HAD superfamily Cof-like phosphohydrolase
MDVQQKVKEFHQAFKMPDRNTPGIPDEQEQQLRQDLIDEEVEELREAIANQDIVEIADALGDIAYVVFGAALHYGIDLNAVIEEIHQSNMSKLAADGQPIYREDGKALKGPNYFPPDLAKVLAEQQDK